MIATVRIAPVKKWCEGIKKRILSRGQQKTSYKPGREVSIHPNLMTIGWMYCDGRVWQLEQSSADEMRADLGLGPDTSPSHFCEHMLEMD